MSTAGNGIRLDGFTLLGLGLVAWLGISAWLLFRPAAGGSTFPQTTVNQAEGPRAPQQPPAAPAAAPVVTEPTPITKEEAQAVAKALEEQPGNPVVRIETTEGVILARLFKDLAPSTADNFADLVEKEFYDGIIFHRVIKEFMLQTGDPTGTGRGGREDKNFPPKRLLDEFHPKLRHDRPGLLSMANAGPNTGDTQFFITTVPTPWLDDKHAIFGEVISGMDVVTKIENTRTGAQDRPVNPPKMIQVRIVSAEDAKKAAEGN